MSFKKKILLFAALTLILFFIYFSLKQNDKVYTRTPKCPSNAQIMIFKTNLSISNEVVALKILKDYIKENDIEDLKYMKLEYFNYTVADVQQSTITDLDSHNKIEVWTLKGTLSIDKNGDIYKKVYCI